MKVKNDHRNKFFNLSNWEEEAWKKSGLQRDSTIIRAIRQFVLFLLLFGKFCRLEKGRILYGLAKNVIVLYSQIFNIQYHILFKITASKNILKISQITTSIFL